MNYFFIKLVLLFLFFSIFLFASESFERSKQELRKIHYDHQITFYCGCKYNYTDKDDMIDRKSCGYVPRNEYTKSGKRNQRAREIEWEHVIPAENFGRQFSCWRDGDPSCIKTNGKSFKGRSCCKKVDKDFKIMEADMHNLQPAIGELNADRSNFRFDFELPAQGQYGQCKFEVDFKDDRAKIKEDLRGVVARTYLYFSKQYDMKLSKQEIQKFQAWDKMYPPDAWEIERNKRIAKVQGNTNSFIEK